MKRLTKFLIVCMVWFSAPAYALDSYTDDMTTTTGWTASNNNGTFTAVTWEGASATKCFVATGSSGNYGGATRLLPVTGNMVHLQTVLDLDNTGAKTAGNQFTESFYFGRFVCGIKYGTDGLFVANSAGSDIEVGTDIVDSGIKTTWDFYIYNGNTSGATVTVYKNNILIGSGYNCGLAATAFPSGTILLRQNSASLNNATTYVDSISAKSWGLNYFAPASVINTWTDADGGKGVSSLISGKMNFTVSSAASGSYARRTKTSIAYPSKVIIECRARNNTLGAQSTSASALNHFGFIIFEKATNCVEFRFCSDGFYVRPATSTFNEVGTNIVTTGQYDTWRIVQYFSTFKCWIWKNGVFIAGNISSGFGGLAGQPAGNFLMSQSGYTVKGDTDVDYLRIYSEDGQLIQTIIE